MYFKHPRIAAALQGLALIFAIVGMGVSSSDAMSWRKSDNARAISFGTARITIGDPAYENFFQITGACDYKQPCDDFKSKKSVCVPDQMWSNIVYSQILGSFAIILEAPVPIALFLGWSPRPNAQPNMYRAYQSCAMVAFSFLVAASCYLYAQPFNFGVKCYTLLWVETETKLEAGGQCPVHLTLLRIRSPFFSEHLV
jgi:hypothetical protein